MNYGNAGFICLVLAIGRRAREGNVAVFVIMMVIIVIMAMVITVAVVVVMMVVLVAMMMPPNTCAEPKLSPQHNLPNALLAPLGCQLLEAGG